MSLIEYHQEYLAILEEIEQTGGEITLTHETRLEAIAREIATKADKADFVFRKLDAESEFYAAEIKRLQAFKRAIDTANDRLRDFIKMQMKALAMSRLDGEKVSLILSKIKPKVVADEEKLDAAFFDEVITRKLNKERVAQELQLGPIEGAHFEDVYTLRISRSKK